MAYDPPPGYVQFVPAGDRLTESEAEIVMLEFLKSCAYWEATYEKIWTYFPLWVKLTKADWVPSNERENEPVWHAPVRNIAAHQDKKKNSNPLLARLTKGDGGFRRTDYVKKPLTLS